MSELSGGWPTLAGENQADDWRLFTDNNVPPSYVETWYDPGDTGLIEDPDPDTTVTLIAQGPFDQEGADMLIAGVRSDVEEERDELRDQAALRARQGSFTVRCREFRFDPRLLALLDDPQDFEEAQRLAGEVFNNAGIVAPGQ